MSLGTPVACYAGPVLGGRTVLKRGSGCWWLATLSAALITTGALQAGAEEAVSADGVVFRESTPVRDEDLARVRGAGGIGSSARLPVDVAVILWDEQPKAKPAPPPSTDGAGSQTAHTSTSVR